MAFDLDTAARDLESRARRYAPIYTQAGLSECVRLLHRNAWAAPGVLQVLQAMLAENPDRARGLDSPLFPKEAAR